MKAFIFSLSPGEKTYNLGPHILFAVECWLRVEATLAIASCSMKGPQRMNSLLNKFGTHLKTLDKSELGFERPWSCVSDSRWLRSNILLLLRKRRFLKLSDDCFSQRTCQLACLHSLYSWHPQIAFVVHDSCHCRGSYGNVKSDHLTLLTSFFFGFFLRSLGNFFWQVTTKPRLEGTLDCHDLNIYLHKSIVAAMSSDHWGGHFSHDTDRAVVSFHSRRGIPLAYEEYIRI